MHTISIITVVLNDLANLKITYKSLFEQTFKDFEWIIKDGSNSNEIEYYFLSEIKVSKLKVNYVRKNDISLYDAMNQAIGYAQNQYVLFLNAGDCIEDKETLNNVNQAIQSNDHDFSFIYGDNIDITSSGIHIYKKARELSYLRNSLPSSHQAIFYNNQVLSKYQYSLKFKIASDYALTAQMYFNGNKKYLKLDFPICKFYLDGISSKSRYILLMEGFEIHRRIIKDTIFIAGIKFIKRYLTFVILDKFPNLYIRLRNITQ